MKMFKKSSISFLVCLIIMQSMGIINTAFAIGPSYLVSGQVNLDGMPADDAVVVLTDLNTGASLTDIVGPNGASGQSGYYLFNLGNLSLAATGGDQIIIDVTATSSTIFSENMVGPFTEVITTSTASTTFIYDYALGSTTATTIDMTMPPASTTFTITPSSGANGTTSPAGVTTVNSGASSTFSMVPDGGYYVQDVLVDGVSVGAVDSYTFPSVYQNHTISATFINTPMPTYTILASTTSANGTISPVGTTTLNSGVSQLYLITPNNGYEISNVLVDGVSVGAVSSYEFTGLAANHTITASFAALPIDYAQIISYAGANGVISPEGMTSVAQGSNITYTITPNPGYEIDVLLVNGSPVAASTTYTFVNVDFMTDSEIQVSFKPILVLTSLGITPATSTIVIGNTQQYTAAALDQFGAPFAVILTWNSSNTAVATIDNNGLVTSLTTGTTTISVSGGGFTASTLLTVNPIPVLTSISLTPASTTIVVGNTQQLATTALDQLGNPIATALTWTSSDPAVATVNNGLITAIATGTTTITATSGLISGSAFVTVTPVLVLTSINITPTSASIYVGNTQQYTSSTLDQLGNTILAAVNWTSSNPAVATIDNATGLATAISAGTTTISAVNGLVTGSALLTVNPAPLLTSLSISPTSSSAAVGTPTQYTATALDQYGVPFAVALSWSSSNLAVATIDNSGLATSLSAGTTTISVSGGGFIAQATLTVYVTPILTSISLTPTSTSIVAGNTQQLATTTLDQFGNPIATALTWNSSDPTVATVSSSGLVTAVAAGTTTITAVNGLISGSALVTVTPMPVIATINISPVSASVIVGNTQQLATTTLDQFGNPITTALTWNSSDPTVATVSASGLVTAVTAGTTTISAASGLVSGSSLITVTTVPLSVATINLTPTSTSIVAGNTQQLATTTLDQFGNPIVTALTWNSSDPTVATVSASGLITAVAAGTTTITAVNGLISGSTIVTVTPMPVLSTISISPLNSSLYVGDTQQYSSSTLDQFNNPIATTLTWSSSNPAVATISATGLVTAIGVGTTSISASNGLISSSTPLTVNQVPALTSITISPTSSTTLVGTPIQFAATPLDQYSAPFATAITWSSSNPAVATVNGSGLVSTISSGTSTIAASGGGLMAQAMLTVTPILVLTTINVSPTSTSIVLGTSTQFTANPLDQLGAPFVATTTWTSSNPLVATIDANGIASTTGVGTTTITATNGLISGSALLTVTPIPVLTSVSISPLASSATVGNTKQFTATTLDQFSSPITAIITWSSSNTNIGTIDQNGLFTAISVGTSIIEASSSSLIATTTITVTAAPSGGGGGGGGGGGSSGGVGGDTTQIPHEIIPPSTDHGPDVPNNAPLKNDDFTSAPAQEHSLYQKEAEKITSESVTTKLDGNLNNLFKKIIGTSKLQQSSTNAIAVFIKDGSENTAKLGAGERAGVLDSFKKAFGKVPTTASDWQDVLKIANGHWTSARNQKIEAASTKTFQTIYKRLPNMKNAKDNAAINIIAYGLRPSNRNTNSEKAAITSFRAIYKKIPTSASDWDIVRAIAYSGAKR